MRVRTTVPILDDLRRDERANYRICLLGMLDAQWSTMLANMQVTVEKPGEHLCITTLSGPLRDQAALMGVLNLVYDLGLVLLSVEREIKQRNGLAQ
jgi:hypothetical protein